MSGAEAPGNWRSRLWPLLLCAVAIAGLRLHTFHEPLERDITWYAVLGHEMLAGRSFYSDLWFHKPPAVKVAFATAELIAGYGPLSIYLLNVVSAVAVLVGVYFAGEKMGGRAGAIWAGAAWVIVSGEIHFQANQPNTEVFMNACAALAFVLLLNGASRRLTWLEVVIVGALAAAASLFKQIGIVPIFLPATVYVAFSPDGPQGRLKSLAHVAVMVGIVVIAWMGMLAYFAAVGHWTDTYEALFVYNSYYASKSRIAFEAMYLLGPAILLIPAALAWYAKADFTPVQQRMWGMYAAGVVGAFLAIVLPGRYFAHYLQLLLPWFAIAFGAGVSLLPSIIHSERRGIEHIVLAIIAVPLALYQGSFYLVPAKDWPMEKYHSPEFAMTYDQADELNRLLEPGETFYDFGHSTGLYFKSGRKPPSGMMFLDPLTEGPLQQKLSERVQEEIETTKPEIMVVRGDFYGYLAELDRTKSEKFFRYLLDHYVPFPDNEQRRMFLLFARKGGRLTRSQNQGQPDR